MNTEIKWILASALIAQALNGMCASTRMPASDVLLRIDTEEPVTIQNAHIEGDLDFTQLKKKTPGGSYGARVGMVKEFYTKLRAPLTLENCVIEGDIITFREERRRLLLKEFFVAFDAPLILKGCRIEGEVAFERLAFYDAVVLEDCVFENEVRFEEVHFSQAPNIQGSEFPEGLTHRKTNWNPEDGALEGADRPNEEPRATITLVLRNSSAHDMPIQFADNRWNLSPHGDSTLSALEGTTIFLNAPGQPKRALLTVTRQVAGQIVDVARIATP